MCNDLGVEISKEKSIVARGTAEFAKGIYHKGLNLKAISPTLVTYRATSVYSDSKELFVELFRLGLTIHVQDYLLIYPEKVRKGIITVLSVMQKPRIDESTPVDNMTWLLDT
jgi:hypothetical protein